MTDDGMDERETLDAEVRAALTPEGVRAGSRARLLARAAADAGARGLGPAGAGGAVAASNSPTPPALTVSRGRSVPLSVFTGVAFALAASLVFALKMRHDREADRAAYAFADAAKEQRLTNLQHIVAERDQLVSSLTGSQVRVVGLSAGETKSPRALMFWDKATDRWTFIAHNLGPLQAGRTYQLWLVTATKKISAGTFAANARGDAFVQATYALDRSALKAVAVTEEPAGGVPQPTGAMVVVGAAGSQ